jgi:5-methylcytosine-specific restriction endonuclease McrA
MNKEKHREANRLYRLNNKDKIKEINKLYRLNNKDKIKEINRLYRLNNKQKRKQTLILTRLNNPHTQRAVTAKYRASQLKATPKFANLKKIREIYKNCPKGYHVDHIVPLQGKEVCGLHVEWNLQYLTPSQNSSKSNKLINDYL